MNAPTHRAALAAMALLLIAPILPLAHAAPPPDPLTPTLDEAELSAHVHYLAGPALNGRRPLSRGSRKARAYIADRFHACHLQPWGDADGFELPFSLGTNMVGLLPGSDPALRDQVVLLTAHYDHVGKGRLGACDNASGVAALLETAESLAQDPPRCSVAFAVLDAEEWGMIGAYAFTRREDVQRARIRAVVNADMLGRRFLELLDNGLIVAGTEFYPQLRGALTAEAKAQGIEAYPAGLDLIGPRGDHAAFLFRPGEAGSVEPQPVFFFSCGAFQGYHTKTDRAENLDYALLTRSARLVNGFVRHLADAEAIEPRKSLDAPDPGELNLFLAMGSEVLQRDKELGLTPKGREACEAWLHKAEACAAGPTYTDDQRLGLVKELPALGPAVQKLLTEAIAPGVNARPDKDAVLYAGVMGDWMKKAAGTTAMWAEYGPLFDEGYRGLIDLVLDQRPVPLFLRGLPEPYSYERLHTTDREILLTDRGEGSLSLDVLELNIQVSGNVARFGRSWVGVYVNGYQTIDCNGTRDELLDATLLIWLMRQPNEAELRKLAKTHDIPEKQLQRMIEHDRSPEQIAAVNRQHRMVLERLTGDRHGATLDDWLGWRLRQLNLSDREAWLSGLLEGENCGFALATLGHLTRREPEASSETVCRVCARILHEPKAAPGVHAAALVFLASRGGEEGLRRLADRLDDSTLIASAPDLADNEPVPFADHPLVRFGKRWHGRFAPSPKLPRARTLGDVAFYELKKATGQDFNRDTAAWRRFLDSDAPLRPDPNVKYSLPPIGPRRLHGYSWQWLAYGG